MNSLSDQFENKMLFRRILILLIMGYLFMASHEAYLFAMKSLESSFSAAEVAGVIAAMHGLPLALIGYLYNFYSKDRLECKKGNEQ
jgi:ABC-type sulfate transport system permease component